MAPKTPKTSPKAEVNVLALAEAKALVKIFIGTIPKNARASLKKSEREDLETQINERLTLLIQANDEDRKKKLKATTAAKRYAAANSPSKAGGRRPPIPPFTTFSRTEKPKQTKLRIAELGNDIREEEEKAIAAAEKAVIKAKKAGKTGKALPTIPKLMTDEEVGLLAYERSETDDEQKKIAKAIDKAWKAFKTTPEGIAKIADYTKRKADYDSKRTAPKSATPEELRVSYTLLALAYRQILQEVEDPKTHKVIKKVPTIMYYRAGTRGGARVGPPPQKLREGYMVWQRTVYGPPAVVQAVLKDIRDAIESDSLDVAVANALDRVEKSHNGESGGYVGIDEEMLEVASQTLSAMIKRHDKNAEAAEEEVPAVKSKPKSKPKKEAPEEEAADDESAADDDANDDGEDDGEDGAAGAESEASDEEPATDADDGADEEEADGAGEEEEGAPAPRSPTPEPEVEAPEVEEPAPAAAAASPRKKGRNGRTPARASQRETAQMPAVGTKKPASSPRPHPRVVKKAPGGQAAMEDQE